MQTNFPPIDKKLTYDSLADIGGRDLRAKKANSRLGLRGLYVIIAFGSSTPLQFLPCGWRREELVSWCTSRNCRVGLAAAEENRSWRSAATPFNKPYFMGFEAISRTALSPEILDCSYTQR